MLAWAPGLGALFLSIYTASPSGGNAQVGVNAPFGSITALAFGSYVLTVVGRLVAHRLGRLLPTAL